MIEEADKARLKEDEENQGISRKMSKMVGGGIARASKNSPSKNNPFSRMSKQRSKQIPPVNDKLISRLQLQRLLDEDDQAKRVLEAKRAIDVIRRFRAERGPDPFQEITHLQENVVLRLDELERQGVNLEFTEVETLKMVSQGLNDALTEVQNQWRTELTVLLESAATLSNTLISLTSKLQDVSIKQAEIQRDIQVE